MCHVSSEQQGLLPFTGPKGRAESLNRGEVRVRIPEKPEREIAVRQRLAEAQRRRSEVQRFQVKNETPSRMIAGNV